MKLTHKQIKQIIKEELEGIMQEEKSITGLPIERDAMEIYRDGIDPQAAAEKLATIPYSFRDFQKFRDAMQFKDISSTLYDWNDEVLQHMMRLG